MRAHCYRALRLSAAQNQSPVSSQRHLPSMGRHLSGCADPNPLLVRQQPDTPCVKPAKGGTVDGIIRGATMIPWQERHLAGRIVKVIGARHKPSLSASLHAALNHDLARDHIKKIYATQICAICAKADIASSYPKPGQLARFNFRTTGGQHNARRPDKAAAIAGDAVGVSDDHIRRLPRNFNCTAKLRALGAHHLIENDPRPATACQIFIPLHHAAQLCGTERTGLVVKNGPRRAYIKLAVLVVRKPLRIGSVNLDQRHAIGCRLHRETTLAIGVGDDLDALRGNRLHRHSADQKQRGCPARQIAKSRLERTLDHHKLPSKGVKIYRCCMGIEAEKRLLSRQGIGVLCPVNSEW